MWLGPEAGVKTNAPGAPCPGSFSARLAGLPPLQPLGPTSPALLHGPSAVAELLRRAPLGRAGGRAVPGAHHPLCPHSFEACEQTTDWLLSRTRQRPRIAVICGSGLGLLADTLQSSEAFSYSEIPNFPSSTGTHTPSAPCAGTLGDNVASRPGSASLAGGLCPALISLCFPVPELAPCLGAGLPLGSSHEEGGQAQASLQALLFSQGPRLCTLIACGARGGFLCSQLPSPPAPANCLQRDPLSVQPASVAAVRP